MGKQTTIDRPADHLAPEMMFTAEVKQLAKDKGIFYQKMKLMMC